MKQSQSVELVGRSGFLRELFSKMAIILSIVLAFTISTSNAFADQPSQVQEKSVNSQYISQTNAILPSADELIAMDNGQLTNLADKYLLMGSTYKEAGDYKIAQESYTTAIELAKNAKNLEILLFANVGLVEARFLSDEIDEPQKNALVEQLKTDYKASGGTMFRSLCPETCPLTGEPAAAYKRNGQFICC